MEITLTKPAVSFLFKMLNRPDMLHPDQPYKAADSAAGREVIMLQKMLMDSGKFITMKKQPDGSQTVDEMKPWTGKLKQRLVDRLKEMCEHHKGAGRMVHNVEGYEDLVAALKGETVALESPFEDEPA